MRGRLLSLLRRARSVVIAGTVGPPVGAPEPPVSTPARRYAGGGRTGPDGPVYGRFARRYGRGAPTPETDGCGTYGQVWHVRTGGARIRARLTDGHGTGTGTA
ncbi:hypothetical protein GCM10022384_27460 [Streptomyces marokkonensis]|uniref:Uncharacterized protein n=1 Tax=Streptomyces marokkonensis TaxID=324855 RepID=A0ABP7Q3K8_9ACTN